MANGTIHNRALINPKKKILVNLKMHDCSCMKLREKACARNTKGGLTEGVAG